MCIRVISEMALHSDTASSKVGERGLVIIGSLCCSHCQYLTDTNNSFALAPPFFACNTCQGAHLCLDKVSPGPC